MARKSKTQTDDASVETRKSPFEDLVRATHTNTSEQSGYGYNAEYIRDMNLSSEQKNMIVENEVRRIVTSKEELQGGLIPCFIDYPTDSSGFSKLYTFIKADTRLVRMAWEYYKDNAENPTVEKFSNLVQSIVGRGEQYRRIEHLQLN